MLPKAVQSGINRYVSTRKLLFRPQVYPVNDDNISRKQLLRYLEEFLVECCGIFDSILPFRFISVKSALKHRSRNDNTSAWNTNAADII